MGLDKDGEGLLGLKASVVPDKSKLGNGLPCLICECAWQIKDGGQRSGNETTPRGR